METITPLFSIDLGKNGGVFAPKNLEELTSWVEKEKLLWSFITNGNDGTHHYNVATQFVNQFSTLLHTVSQAKSYTAPQHTSHLANQITQSEAQIRSLYLTDGFPHSSSALGKRVSSLTALSPYQAIGYLHVFTKNQENNGFVSNRQDAWAGYLTAIFEKYEIGAAASKTLSATKSSWLDFQTKAETNLGADLAKYASLSNDWSKLNDGLISAATKRQTDFDTEIEKNKSNFSAVLEAHQSKMIQLQATYKEDMSLRAPVAYWESKQIKHDDLSRQFGLAAFVLLALLGWVAYALFDVFDAKRSISNAQLGLSAVMGLSAVWAIRLIIRMFLSNQHLASDAAERVTMAKTYLSLAEGEKAIPDEDRKLILQALFRPGTDGLVKDESIPHPALDAMTKLTGK